MISVRLNFATSSTGFGSGRQSRPKDDNSDQPDLLTCFGHSVNWSSLPNVSTDIHHRNHWAWLPDKVSGNLVKLVYQHLNKSHCSYEDYWDGWSLLWKLPVAPRIKTFLWRAFHGRLPTLELLYYFNIGTQELCPVCGLTRETLEHVMCGCNLANQCWDTVSDVIGINRSELSNFLDGGWLMSMRRIGRGDSNFNRAVIATCAWKIWQARCALVFNHVRPCAQLIVQQSFSIAKEHLWKIKYHCREYLSTSFNRNSITIMCDAAWSPDYMSCGIGFIAIAGSETIRLAGCLSRTAESSLHAEVVAIGAALVICMENGINIARICTDCIYAVEVLTSEDVQITQSMHADIQAVKDLLNSQTLVMIDYCPRELNLVADALARRAFNNPTLTLFHQGYDRPRWLDEIASAAGLMF